jgi:hypothetical protein
VLRFKASVYYGRRAVHATKEKPGKMNGTLWAASTQEKTARQKKICHKAEIQADVHRDTGSTICTLYNAEHASKGHSLGVRILCHKQASMRCTTSTGGSRQASAAPRLRLSNP